MPDYPVPRATFVERISKFAYLGKRNVWELDDALNTARSEVELACPAAATGGLDDRLDRAAATIQHDLAVYYLRLEVERDESGSPPKSLQTLWERIQLRLEKLAMASAVSTGSYTIEVFERLADPPLPGETVVEDD